MTTPPVIEYVKWRDDCPRFYSCYPFNDNNDDSNCAHMTTFTSHTFTGCVQTRRVPYVGERVKMSVLLTVRNAQILLVNTYCNGCVGFSEKPAAVKVTLTWITRWADCSRVFFCLYHIAQLRLDRSWQTGISYSPELKDVSLLSTSGSDGKRQRGRNTSQAFPA